MSFDVRKHIKQHSIAFAIYSAIAVTLICYGYSNYFGITIMIIYAYILGLHALVALFDFIILSKNKEARLKGILVILAIGIIGFGLCTAPIFLLS